MFEEKSSLLGVILTILAIIGSIATLFSCLIGFMVFVNPKESQEFIVRLYFPETSTPRVITVTALTPTSPTMYTPYPTATSYPTSTPYPTYTPYPMPPPTSTPKPVVISLPFEDTFDLRPRAEWEPIKGSWRVVDGRLTTDPNDDWSLILVGDQEWSNYAVDVDVWSDEWFYPVRIIVRTQDAGYVAIETDINGTDWILSSDGGSRVIAHRDEGIYERHDQEYHFRIEA
jgi:hypothetical protein